MVKRKLCLILALLLALAGCAAPDPGPVESTPAPTPTPSAPAAEGERRAFALAWSGSGDLNPIHGTRRVDLTLAPLVWRGLFALGRDFAPQNDLCTGYEVSEDGLVWTFRLADVTFSDGSPLDAMDVVTSLNAARRSERYGERLKDMIKVNRVDEGTVRVTLSRPNGALPALLDVPVVREGDPYPLGTGPYYLAEGPVLKAREGAEVPVDVIPLRPVGSVDELVLAFDGGEVSVVDADLTGTNQPGYAARVETVDYPTTGLIYVGFNAAKGVCKDVDVRRGLSLALDRAAVVEEDLLGHAVAAALPVHPEAAGYDAEAAGTLAYQPEGALETLNAAGWRADGEGTLTRYGAALELKFVVNQENSFKAAAAGRLAADLEELGCRVTLEKLPWEEYLAALEKGEFDLYLGETMLTADFDPESLMGTGGALNYGKWGDKETDALVAAFRTAGGEAGAALWEAFAREAPLAPICFKNGSMLLQWGQVTGAAPTQRDLFNRVGEWEVGMRS